MPAPERAYALFESHTDGMRLHAALRKAGVPHEICPTPRDLDESCGIALRFDAERSAVVEGISRECPVPVRIVRRGRTTNTDGGDAVKGE